MGTHKIQGLIIPQYLIHIWEMVKKWQNHCRYNPDPGELKENQTISSKTISNKCWMYINFLVALKLCRKAPVPVARDGQQNPGVHEERPVYHPPCHVHHPLPLPNQVRKPYIPFSTTSKPSM